MKQLGLLIRLIIGIIAGILIGMCGQWFGIADTAFFVTIIRLLATFTSLFSTFLSFMIPLIILSFITVGMAELGKKANRLFGLTLLLAYGHNAEYRVNGDGEQRLKGIALEHIAGDGLNKSRQNGLADEEGQQTGDNGCTVGQ